MNPKNLRLVSYASNQATAALERLTGAYLAQCRVEGKTPDTVRIYALTLRNLLDAVQAEILPPDIATWEATDMVRFFDWLAFDKDGKRKISPATLHQRQRSSRTFLKWCVTTSKVITSSPMEGVKNTKLPEKILPILRPSEFRDVMEKLDFGKPSATKARNKAIVLMLLDAGPRLQELVGLQEDDVKWDEHIIHVREGKGQKERFLPLGDALHVALFEYTSVWRPRIAGALFFTEEGKPITEYTVTQMLWRLGERCGLSERLGPHMLRRSFATWSLDNGADLRHVQELMGHTNPRTTLHYAKQRDMRQAAAAHSSFSPVGEALKSEGKKKSGR